MRRGIDLLWTRLDRARDLDEVTSGYAAMSARLHTMFPEALRHHDRSGRRDRHQKQMPR